MFPFAPNPPASDDSLSRLVAITRSAIQYRTPRLLLLFVISPLECLAPSTTQQSTTDEVSIRFRWRGGIEREHVFIRAAASSWI